MIATEVTRALEAIRDLRHPSRARFWGDLLASAGVGWGALVAAVATGGAPRVGWAALAVLAMWRAVQFIHELVHLPRGAVPGVQTCWNALVGVPFFLPTFLFDTHLEHHRASTFGGADDPEYLPLLDLGPSFLVIFFLEGALAPLALWLRFAVLAPASWLCPPLRRLVLTRTSTLGMNHHFVRRDLDGGSGPPGWRVYEIVTTLWAVAALLLVVRGVVPLRALLTWAAIAAGVGLLNNAKTLVVHRFLAGGDRQSHGQQVSDAVNVSGGPWSELWAPLGNRFHALHHLCPSLPFHNVARAHARLVALLPAQAAYHDTVERSLSSSLRWILAHQRRRRQRPAAQS